MKQHTMKQHTMKQTCRISPRHRLSCVPLGLVALLVLAAAGCGGSDDVAADAATDGAGSACSADAECDDGLFCNGAERCASESCAAASSGPCAEGERCEEDGNRCDACGAPLSPPRLLSPENGALTGSFRPGGTLRPLFRWALPASCGALSHDIEIDDSCTTPGFASCTFPSPESRSAGLASPSYRPASDLPVSAAVPVGRRYYWRVRSCDDTACSAWSRVRYLDVGRVPSDMNGDAYADLVVGAPEQDAGARAEGNAFVYYGSASGLPALPSQSLDNPANQEDGHFGNSVAFAGDVNGDGYADLVVGAFYQDAGASDEGNAFVYYGSASTCPPARASPSTTPPISGAAGSASASPRRAT